MLSASRTALPHYCRTRSGASIPLPVLGSAGKVARKTTRVAEVGSSKALTVQPLKLQRGRACSSAFIYFSYVFTSFRLILCWVLHSMEAHTHTKTHFTNSRNKRENFVPSLTPESKKDTDHQQLKTLRSLLSLDVQAAKLQSPHTGHPQPMNIS